ncbi:MAG: tetratricopeptide repeat protein [Congregibacter sp.]
MRGLCLLLLSLMLTACVSGPEPVPPQSPAARSGSSAGATPATTTPAPGNTVGGAPAPIAAPVDNLLVQARRYRDSGDFDRSFARLDRALRIAPQRADVYLELARSYLAAGKPERAAASAERGLLYCEGGTCRALRRFLKS